MEVIINIVRTTFEKIIAAIDGQIIMTPRLVTAIESIYDAKVPQNWMYDPTEREISWLYPRLGKWFESIQLRNSQLVRWLAAKPRINPFWMTGFFNPQGFITAMTQEYIRIHKRSQRNYGNINGQEAIALDDVVQVSRVTTDFSKTPLNTSKMEGVYIAGLFLEGAQWLDGSLEEPVEKTRYDGLPVLHMTAERKSKNKPDMELMSKYNCPIYKYKKRTDQYLITRVKLNCGEKFHSAYWRKRGVALLCSTND